LKEPRVGHEALWKSASPVTYVTKKTPPTLILHGLADTTVNHDQATELAAKLKELGVEHEIHMIPGIGHTFDFETWNRKPLPQDLRPIALAFFDKYLKEGPTTSSASAGGLQSACVSQPTTQASESEKTGGLKSARRTIRWDSDTLRYLCPGGYPRMIRLADGATLLSCEDAERAVVRRSEDGGKTWSEPVEAARGEHGAAANPQPLALKSGATLLFYNDRPKNLQGAYSISFATSHDGGKSWSRRPEPIYNADFRWDNGCWEPAAVQQSSGEILLFFANESPYRNSDEQEISITCSQDNGATWSNVKAFSFRKGGRDGMPVPLILQNGDLVVAIEDTGGRTTFELQPSIIRANAHDSSVVGGTDPRRYAAVEGLNEKRYAGAPYIVQLTSGDTVLSCQTGKLLDGPAPRPTFFVGDSTASHFGEETLPFEDNRGEWSSMYVREDGTIVALTGARMNGKAGVWAIDGKLIHQSGDTSR
jgi:hypothetical protein